MCFCLSFHHSISVSTLASAFNFRLLPTICVVAFCQLCFFFGLRLLELSSLAASGAASAVAAARCCGDLFLRRSLSRDGGSTAGPVCCCKSSLLPSCIIFFCFCFTSPLVYVSFRTVSEAPFFCCCTPFWPPRHAFLAASARLSSLKLLEMFTLACLLLLSLLLLQWPPASVV